LVYAKQKNNYILSTKQIIAVVEIKKLKKGKV